MKDNKELFVPRLRFLEENTIGFCKRHLKEHGYSWVQERFNGLQRCLDNYVLSECHLLSIARWEYQYESGDKSRRDLNDIYKCGLCLYYGNEPGCLRCKETKDCCLYDHVRDAHCPEYARVNIDNGLSLIQRLRREFVKKYYDKVWIYADKTRTYAKEHRMEKQGRFMVVNDRSKQVGGVAEYGTYYWTNEGAREEAEKLTQESGKKHYVYKAIGYYESVKQPIKWVEL